MLLNDPCRSTCTFIKTVAAAAILLLWALPIIGSHAQGTYLGKLQTEWVQDDERDMRIINVFSFKDKKGVEWPVPKGTVVNGASIPRFLWSIVGGPFSGNYRAASVIHDYYCVAQSRPAKDTHGVFYHAMLASGVPSSKAWVMHQAVKRFGPKWEKLREVSRNCFSSATIGDDCVFNTHADATSIAIRPSKEQLLDFEKLVRQKGFKEEADAIKGYREGF